MKGLALTLVVLTLLGGRQAKSATFDYDTVIDYYFADTVEVHDGTASTTVDIVSGATVVYGAEVYQTSTMNVHGGIIYNNLIADDLSTANIYGGWFDKNVRGKDFSTINLFGGHVEDTLEATDSATVNVFRGRVLRYPRGWKLQFHRSRQWVQPSLRCDYRELRQANRHTGQRRPDRRRLRYLRQCVHCAGRS